MTQSPTILLIEDNRVMRKLFHTTLQNAGYTILEASDAKSALALMETHCPDLILQDMILPDINGFELVQKLRSFSRGAEIPILALSGFLSRVDEAKIAEAGFTDLLIKPLEPLALLSAVQMYLASNHDETPSSDRRTTCRILIADDNPMQRKLARLLLEQRGFQVLLAFDGIEALTMTQQELPDVVVSDVLMPRLDGFGLCLAIRKDPHTESIPVVLASSQYIADDDRKFGLSVGANDFVVRTPKLKEVIQAIESVIDQKKPKPSEPDMPPHEEHIRRVTLQLERQISLNTNLAQRCALQAAELMLLGAISEALTHNEDTQSAMDDVLACCLDVGGISHGILYRKEADNTFTPYLYGTPTNAKEELKNFFGQPAILQNILEQLSPITFPSETFLHKKANALLEKTGISSVLIVPILSQNQAVGALLFASENENLDEPGWLVFAKTVAGQLGQAIALTKAFNDVASSEERFRTLVESIEDAVFTLDHEQTCTGFYGSSLSKEEVSFAGFLGKKPQELFEKELAQIHNTANQKALQGENVVFEWSMKTPERKVHFQTSLSPMRKASGKIYGLVGVSRNITNQKYSQEQLLVSERMASIGMLAAGVAHEINNPLAAVIANLDFMSKTISQMQQESDMTHSSPDLMEDVLMPSGYLVEQLKESLHDAQEGAERVRQIVRDLKILSRPDEEYRGPVDVRRVIESSLRIAWNEIRHRARLTKDYGELEPVEANEARLGQLFLNLIVNAAQAIPAGQADQNLIRIRAFAENEEQVIIEISDTGPGIPQENLSQIFSPFFSTKPIGTGTGLGLAICQRIVDNLNGKIEVESEVGVGTTFRVRLPVSPLETDSKPTQRVVIRPVVRRGKILAVDDEPLIGTVLKRILQEKHEVIHIADGQEALACIAEGERFDVILCDLMMPTITGMELYEEIHQIAPEQAEKMLFITGGTFTPQARDFLERFTDRTLEKPFEPQHLQEVLAKWL